ncbi:hypothetical protein ACMFMF_002229 [Clarireedia jacksonii]
MASPAEDMSDSRSSVVGRKRALQTSSERDQGAITIDSSSDESDTQLRKRIRKDEDQEAEATADAVKSLSSSPQDQPANNVDTEPSELSPLPAQGNLGLPGAWNQGVQSGLRTSFGKKITKKQTGTLGQYKVLAEQQSNGTNAANTSDAKAIVEALQPAAQGTIKVREDEVMTNESSLENNDLDAVGEDKRRNDDAVMKPVEVKATKGAEKSTKREKKRSKNDSMISQTEAAAAYMEVHGWPIPKDNAIAKAISSRKTYYPVTTRGPTLYTFGDNKIELPELVNPNGRPITLQDLNFRAFILFIFAENPDLKNKLTDKRAKAAFNEYITHFYGHVPEFRSFHTTQITSKYPLLENIIKNPESLSGLSAIGDATSKDAHTSQEEVSAPDRMPKTDINSATQANINPEVEVISNGSGLEEFHENNASENSGRMDAASIEDPEDLLKYFPTADGAFIPKCLVCGSSAHQASQCPDSTCSSCGTQGNHLTPACPQTLVCGKCRQPGHQTSRCPEKLRATQDVNCIICQSPNHIEVKCHFIWRSFLPQPHEIRTVQDIQICCYCCGASGHYGPDCGLHQGIPLSGGLSWSRANLQKYLDPSSASRAVSAGKDYSIPSRSKKGFSIKGRANDPIELDDSDGDDDDTPAFIRPKVNNAPKHGQIQFSQAVAPAPQFMFQGNGGGNNNPRALPPHPPNSRGGGHGNNKKRGGGNAPNRGEPPGRGNGRGKAGRGRGAPPSHRRRG